MHDESLAVGPASDRTTDAARATAGSGNGAPRFNSFEFAVIAGLRAAQLARGCIPRVPRASKVTVTARREVAAGIILRTGEEDPHAQSRRTRA